MRVISILVAVLLGAATCPAQVKVVSRVSVRKHREYAQLPEALRELVREDGKAGTNTFYACRVEQFSNGYHHAWVYWKEGNSIILVEPDHGAYDRKYLLVWSRRYLHLEKDVVPTLDDVGGSSYLVTREWARNTIRDCVRQGDEFTVNKPARNNRRAQSNNGMQRTRTTAALLRLSSVRAADAGR